MTATAMRRERLTMSLATFRRIGNVALVLLVLIVFSGAGVRLTGSGLGCPDWPQCHGTLTPELSSHVAMEYGNRLLSGLVGIPCIVLALMAWRVRRPPDAPAIENERRVVLGARALTAWGGLIITLGTFVTAAGPHAGGAGTGDVVERMTAIPLTTMIYIHGHSATAMALFAIAMWVYARRRGATPGLRMSLTAVCVLIAVQGALGLTQYHLALPAEIVWAHASLAAVLWVAFVAAWLAAGRARPA